jgi:hypothetical protein
VNEALESTTGDTHARPRRVVSFGLHAEVDRHVPAGADGTCVAHGQRNADLQRATERTPEKRLEGFVRFLIEDLKDPMTNAIFFELWSIGQRDRFAMTMVDQFYHRYVTNFDHMIAAINPKLDPKRRTTRAALAATQIEGLMILLARGRPRHAYLVGIERECVAQILRLAMQP